MSRLVVGSTAFDTIETPHGTAADCLGGSSTYFSLAARLFTQVHLVSVVGEDFPPQHRKLLEDRGVDLSGVEQKPGKTFRWHGRYSSDMNSRETLDVQLNTFGDFRPKVPATLRSTPFVFLANGSPATQRSGLEQMDPPRFSVAAPLDRWSEVLAGLVPVERDGRWRNAAESGLDADRADQWRRLVQALQQARARAQEAGLPLPERLAVWQPWIVPVGRLSFPTGSAVSALGH